MLLHSHRRKLFVGDKNCIFSKILKISLSCNSRLGLKFQNHSDETNYIDINFHSYLIYLLTIKGVGGGCYSFGGLTSCISPSSVDLKIRGSLLPEYLWTERIIILLACFEAQGVDYPPTAYPGENAWD